MHACVLAQARDLVLHLQLAALELHHLQVVDRRMRESFVYLVFEGPVASFEFRKMRLNGHVACLLVRLMPDTESLHQAPPLSTLVWGVHCSNPLLALPAGPVVGPAQTT